jgi:hypothetical protein
LGPVTYTLDEGGLVHLLGRETGVAWLGTNVFDALATPQLAGT